MSRLIASSPLLLPCVILTVCVALVTVASAQTPVINEFMASNATTIPDDDGDYSDWIEIHNPSGAEPVQPGDDHRLHDS